MISKFLFITLSLTSMILANDDEPSARIIGGKVATRNTYNYMVNIITKASRLCGGSLIAKDTIITAAHCTKSTEPEYYTIRGKIHNFVSEEGEQLKATKVIVHPDFNIDVNADNDIALIKIDPNHSINSFLNLGTSYSARVNTIVVVTGWGLTKSNGTTSDELKELKMKVIDPSICSNNIVPLNSYSHFCATGIEPGSSTCKGDSGSPVVTEDLRTIVGVVSYGSENCSMPLSGLTRVSNYVEWIHKHTNLGSEQTSKVGSGSGDDKSNPKPDVNYPLGNCNKSGDSICLQKGQIGVCVDNRSVYPYDCPKGTTCKLDDGKAYCSR